MSHHLQPISWRKPAGLAALTLTLALTGCAAGNDDDEPASGIGMHGVEERTAERVVQVSSVHPETGMTLIEGPTAACSLLMSPPRPAPRR